MNYWSRDRFMLINSFKFKPVTSVKHISLWILLLSSLVSCGASQIYIRDISSKIGKTVHLTGEVVHLAPLIDRTAYQIEDTTGKTWVVTATVPPIHGQQIDIKGTVQYQSLPFAKQELGNFYVVELERIDPNDKE